MATAKLFQTGRSQAVRLPKEFRFPGKEVRIRRHGMGVLLEPLHVDPKEWFAAMAATGGDPIDDEDARFAGIIRADLRKNGTRIGPYDVLIAGQALRHDLLLVTANVREFE